MRSMRLYKHVSMKSKPAAKERCYHMVTLEPGHKSQPASSQEHMKPVNVIVGTKQTGTKLDFPDFIGQRVGGFNSHEILLVWHIYWHRILAYTMNRDNRTGVSRSHWAQWEGSILMKS